MCALTVGEPGERRTHPHGATDLEYDERQYNAEDLRATGWTFSERLDDVAPEEWSGESLSWD
jgi:hypothetical protein